MLGRSGFFLFFFFLFRGRPTSFSRECRKKIRGRKKKEQEKSANGGPVKWLSWNTGRASRYHRNALHARTDAIGIGGMLSENSSVGYY